MSRDRGAAEHFAPGRPAQPVRSNVDYWDGLDATRIETVGTLEGKRIAIIGLTREFHEFPYESHRTTHSLDAAEHLFLEGLSQVAAARGGVQ